MDEAFQVSCPYCGEVVELYIEADVAGVYVQDCEVCCQPWLIQVKEGDEGRSVSITRADGSE